MLGALRNAHSPARKCRRLTIGRQKVCTVSPKPIEAPERNPAVVIISLTLPCRELLAVAQPLDECPFACAGITVLRVEEGEAVSAGTVVRESNFSKLTGRHSPWIDVGDHF